MPVQVNKPAVLAKVLNLGVSFAYNPSEKMNVVTDTTLPDNRTLESFLAYYSPVPIGHRPKLATFTTDLLKYFCSDPAPTWEGVRDVYDRVFGDVQSDSDAVTEAEPGAVMLPADIVRGALSAVIQILA